MSCCQCIESKTSPVVAEDVIDSCDGHSKIYQPCQKEGEVEMVCTQPIPMKIIATKKRGEDQGPIGMITRNQDFDIIGSKTVFTCLCGMRNGLDHVCKRISCQNNPGCHMNPPRCWPKYTPTPVIKREIEGPVQICFVKTKNCQ